MIAPASAESPILATGIPAIVTFAEPLFITAPWGTQDLPERMV